MSERSEHASMLSRRQRKTGQRIKVLNQLTRREEMIEEVVDTGVDIVIPPGHVVVHVEDRPNGSRIVITQEE